MSRICIGRKTPDWFLLKWLEFVSEILKINGKKTIIYFSDNMNLNNKLFFLVIDMTGVSSQATDMTDSF